MLLDALARPLSDLRVSVTDRCNFRCTYCMPREVFGADFAFVDREELLTFEELTRVVGVFVDLGVRKVRLTGGEPLLRRDLHRLVGMLAAIEGLEDLAITTNGSLLRRTARALREAGLQRVTVSLDSVEEQVFSSMTDVDVPLQTVLDGLAAAARAELPVKVNAVVKRGVNDDGILDLARFGREHGHTVRFIEYMDVGTANGWRLDEVVPAAEIVDRIAAVHPLEPIAPTVPGEVATRWRYIDGAGEIGVIASVTEPFCATCTRARISATGTLYTCLFASDGLDLRDVLRSGAGDGELKHQIASCWTGRTDRYSEERGAATAGLPKVEMHHIGG